MWRRWLERRAASAWYGGAWWAVFLLPFSLVASVVIHRKRHRFLEHPPAPAPVPVIVIGGITVGGTGKSPVLIALARALGGHGLRVGVVSRGYGGTASASPHMVDPERDSALSVGDEPLLIARTLHTPVVVCRDRALAIAHLVGQCEVDVVLSDDGLQHYRMARDYEIAVLDAQRGLGNGWLLPAGPLREPAARLESVDWLLARNGQDPAQAFHYDIIGLRRAGTREQVSLVDQHEAWGGLKLRAVTGLGQPEQFFDMLRSHGLAIETLALADHAQLTHDHLARLEDDIILVTAKDEVKLSPQRDARVWVVDIAAVLPDELVDSVLAKIEERRGTACSTS